MYIELSDIILLLSFITLIYSILMKFWEKMSVACYGPIWLMSFVMESNVNSRQATSNWLSDDHLVINVQFVDQYYRVSQK